MGKYHWIREEIPLPAYVPEVLKNTIREAEEADLAHSYEYFCIADAIDVLGKRFVASGKWTQKDWDDICTRYPQA